MTRTLHTALVGACLALPVQPRTHAAIQVRTAVAIADQVNVRGRPEARSEVIAQLARGRRVTVLEEVAGPTLDGSPELWSRIALPSDTPVWVFADFVDSGTGEVTVRLLNLRSGKGEEHVIVGILLKGERVEQLRREGDWLEIKAPIGAYGYVASGFLEAVELLGGTPGVTTNAVKSPPAGVVPTGTSETSGPSEVLSPAEVMPAGVTPAHTPPEPAPVIETPPVAPVRDLAVEPAPVTPPQSAAPVPMELIIPVDSRPAAPAPRRIAIREGIVRRTLSIQAPGRFELRHSATGDRLAFLHPANPKIEIKPLHRRRVRVRGEEFIDPRWPNCAVLFVEHITLAP